MTIAAAAEADALVEIRVPSAQTEGTRSEIARWLKKIGDRVERDEPLLELETDKVVVEVAAPATGVLREILREVGQPAAPGELLGRIATSPRDDSGRARDESPRAPQPAQATPASSVRTAAIAESSADRSAAHRLSPSVRRLLAECGLDPRAISGTGRGGRITADDVQRYRSSGQTIERPATAAGAQVSGDVERIPHSATRRRIAEHMVQSLLQTAPHVTTVFEADLSAVLAHRARHRAEFESLGVPLTLTAYFALACIDGIRAVPEVNARWTPDAIELQRRINLGIATAVEERGLLVPVIHDLGALNLFGIAQRLADLTQRARNGSLKPEDMRGGTFTISNHGVSGSLVASPIVINQPQSAILGIGKLEKRVVVIERDGEESIAIRPRCYVTLTIDHRVMDGHRANKFLTAFVRRLETFAD